MLNPRDLFIITAFHGPFLVRVYVASVVNRRRQVGTLDSRSSLSSLYRYVLKLSPEEGIKKYVGVKKKGNSENDTEKDQALSRLPPKCTRHV